MAIEYGGSDGNGARQLHDAAWGRRTSIRRGGAELYSLSCSSASFCAAVGEDGLTATYTGGRWSLRDDVNNRRSNGDLYSVGCASRRFCLAVGSYGYAIGWNGKVWHKAARAPYGRTVRDLYCATDGQCVAVDALGYGIRLANSRWSVLGAADPVRMPITTLECGSPQLCFAADEAGNIWRYDGTAWGPPTRVDRHADPGLEAAPSLSCVDAASCVLEDWRGYTRVWNGRTWADGARSPFLYENDLSCVRASWCMSIGFDGHWNEHYKFSVFHGRSWASPERIIKRDGGIGFDAPKCTSTSFCLATFDGTRFSVFGGQRWTKPDAIRSGAGAGIKPDDEAVATACPSAQQCLILTFLGRTWTYDGAWSRESAPLPDRTFWHLACASLTWCMAGNHNGDVYFFDGANWAASAPGLFPSPSPYANAPVEALACAGRSLCVATDGTRMATTTH